MNFKVFVAGPQSLNQKKDLFRVVSNKLSVEYALKGYDLAILTYASDDFVSYFEKGGGQDKYDRFIVDEADLFICYFEGKITGVATIKELAIAYNTYMKKGHPRVSVFIKGGEGKEARIAELQRMLAKHIKLDDPQYFQEYDKSSLLGTIRDVMESSIKEIGPAALRPNCVELNGLKRQAEIYLKERNWDEGLRLLRRAYYADINLWEYYSELAKICARKYPAPDSFKLNVVQLGVDAYSKAEDCLLPEDVATKSLIMACRGGLRKRLAIQQGYPLNSDDTILRLAQKELEEVLHILKNGKLKKYSVADPYVIGVFDKSRMGNFYYDLLSVYSLLGDRKKFTDIETDLRDLKLPGSRHVSFEEVMDRVKENYPVQWI
jgi:hypothetical protein